MKLLQEINDDSFPKDGTNLFEREASRAVLFDEQHLIPVLYVSKYNYHKLPGGGIDWGESRMTALIRECLEEVGCEIEIRGELGMFIEYRSGEKFDWELNMKQTSYCFLGNVLSKGKPNFTDEEINDGFEVVWLSIDDAIKTLENDNPKNLEGTYILKRDLTFLREAKNTMQA